jgi:hypothetical protein
VRAGARAVPVVAVGLLAAAALSLPATALAASCPNESLRVGRSAALPDCRAYELVTPGQIDSAEGDMEFKEDLARALASGDGEHLALHTLTVFFEPGAHHTGTDAVFSRTAGGWVMRSLTAPGMGAETFPVRPPVFSPNFSQVGFLYSSGSNAREPETLALGAVGGPYAPLVAGIPVETTAIRGANAGASGVAPLSDVVVESEDRELLPAGPERQAAEETHLERADLYQWSGGRLHLVQLDNAAHLLDPCGANVGGGPEVGDAVNAVSADGSRVFFGSPSQPEPAPCFQPALYMRVEGRETVDVSAPEEGTVIPRSERGRARFDGASPDGSRVFFTSDSELTPGAGVGPYLYEYLTEAAPEHRLKLIAGRVEPPEGQFSNPSVVVSGDGSVVYYKGTGTVQVAGQAVSVFGVWRYDTSAASTSFVAKPDPVAGEPQPEWYTTSDGRFLLFPAGHGGQGTGVRVLGPHGLEEEARGFAHQEFYRYDANDGSVTCVSCGEGVAPPTGFAEIPTAGLGGVGAILPTAGGPGAPVEMSRDGGHVFFESSARLVAQDTNQDTAEEEELEDRAEGRGRAADVYEWVAPGIEDGPGTFCHAVNGCTFLLSAGESVGPEQFLGASEDGRDVFLSSAASLVPGAPAGFTSIYDARIGGGFPQQAGPVECTSCQGVGNPPPLFGTPSSATFSGAGNPSLAAPSAGAPKSKPKPKPKPRCRRGYRRNRHGRCVRVTHSAARPRQ